MYTDTRKESRRGLTCDRCGDEIGEDDLVSDEYGRPLHEYCSDDDRTPPSDDCSERG